MTGLQLAAQNDYDAIVLDWMLPRMNGAEVVQAVRDQLRKTLPVLMLTARERTDDKVHALRAGADDYLVKPFELAELEARLEAQVRRARGLVATTVLQVADLVLDLTTAQVRRGGQPIAMQPACRRLLEELMRASPAMVSRERLEQAVWGDALPDRDLLRSQVHMLRRAIDGPFECKLLHTVPRTGYRIEATADDANASG